MKKKSPITKAEALALALAALLLTGALMLSGHRRPQTAVSLSVRPQPAVTLPPEQRLDPDLATAEQLEELPGVGEVLAERILARRALAPIDGPEDLLAVEGLGEATLAAIEPYIIY